ncbi:hypothetical protein ACFL27_00725 [candidate division CSSED10-310 bacterium]|uniref:Uncharacterized protein n=1 Tax=candidate division CSSED10-310 bacterium TaxID=2855610 RepID=A0ABV6YR68_UNCC1
MMMKSGWKLLLHWLLSTIYDQRKWLQAAFQLFNSLGIDVWIGHMGAYTMVVINSGYTMPGRSWL